MYDIIGDVHSCYEEFVELLEKLGYTWIEGRNSLQPPNNRKLVLVGDFIDRGYFPYGVFALVENMVEDGNLVIARGNHEDKLLRYSRGNSVKLLHGLDKTVDRLEKLNVSKERMEKLCNLPFYLLLDDGKLIISHAGWKDKYISKDPFDKKIRSYCIFGPTTGQFVDGFPERIDWAKDRKQKSPVIIHGHQPVKEVRRIRSVYNIDTGCVFGGKLTAIQYPEMEIIQVSAKQTYCKETKWGYE